MQDLSVERLLMQVNKYSLDRKNLCEARVPHYLTFGYWRSYKGEVRRQTRFALVLTFEPW